MARRKKFTGVCWLCVLVLSMIAAQGAAAEGTTAHTCIAVESGAQFSESHCKAAQAGGSGFKHEAIPNDTTTKLTGSGGGAKLKSVSTGIQVELQPASLGGEGWMENREENGEMYTHGQMILTLSGITMSLPSGKGCEVFADEEGAPGAKGLIVTNVLASTTKGQGDFLKIEPLAGEVLATFWIQNCKGSAPFEALNKTYTITGSVKGVPNGATVEFTHLGTTEQNTLKLNGSHSVGKVGLAGTITLSARASAEEALKPLSATT